MGNGKVQHLVLNCPRIITYLIPDFRHEPVQVHEAAGGGAGGEGQCEGKSRGNCPRGNQGGKAEKLTDVKIESFRKFLTVMLRSS